MAKQPTHTTQHGAQGAKGAERDEDWEREQERKQEEQHQKQEEHKLEKEREKEEKEREKEEDQAHKKYVAAAQKTPVGTMVWYWSAPDVDPLAAIIAGREDAEHCHLFVISPLGQSADRQSVLQAQKGDEVEGEYFQAMGTEALKPSKEYQKSQEAKAEAQARMTPSTNEVHQFSASGGILS